MYSEIMIIRWLELTTAVIHMYVYACDTDTTTLSCTRQLCMCTVHQQVQLNEQYYCMLYNHIMRKDAEWVCFGRVWGHGQFVPKVF